jgi:hypothetical protein
MYPYLTNIDINALITAIQAAMQLLISRLETIKCASMHTLTTNIQIARAPALADALRANPAPRTNTTQQTPKTAPVT